MGPGLSISAAADSQVNRVGKLQIREAYEVFLRAHQAWQSPERHRMQDGLQQLTRAIELDPSLIAAKVDLIHLCVNQAYFGYMAPQLSANIVRLTAEQIPDLLDRAPEVLPALGWVHLHEDRDLEAASRAFEMSAHLPHNPCVTRARSLFALSNQRFDQAIALLRTAIQADPFSPSLQGRLAWALHLDGRTTESVEQIENTLELYPDHLGAAFYGAMILAFNGHPERGEQIARDLASRHPYFDLAGATHAYALACSGREIEAKTILERLQWLSRERFVLKSSFFPAVHVALGDYDSALVELNAANEVRCPWFFQMLADPRLKPLHGREEFQRLRAILPQMEMPADGLSAMV
jgi:tetratricopeptide (TPR) repeat protein